MYLVKIALFQLCEILGACLFVVKDNFAAAWVSHASIDAETKWLC